MIEPSELAAMALAQVSPTENAHMARARIIVKLNRMTARARYVIPLPRGRQNYLNYIRAIVGVLVAYRAHYK